MQEQILYFFQSLSSPLTDTLVQSATMLGEQYVFMLIMAVFYWGISKERGLFLASVMLFSLFFNNMLKILFQTPRPFDVLEGLKGHRLETATGWSFPSGHTQGAAGFYGALFCLCRNRLVRTLCGAIIFLIGFSRVYLGVHWPADVLGGWFFGILTVLAVKKIFDAYEGNERGRDRFFLVSILIVLGLTITTAPAVFLTLCDTAKADDFFKSAGLLIGGLSGFLLEKRFFGFDAGKGSLRIRMLRIAAGFAGALLLQAGLKILLPDLFYFHSLRYLLLGGWFTLFYPCLGRRIGLFSAS